ncbi:MAG: GNAT family N-acetyltransferase [Chloroflexia bacterium]|jgi:GNAT superfamily N-acetyltransferase|nr:GNAT family N-acetyltransferase [Chloroflexia bacterium]
MVDDLEIRLLQPNDIPEITTAFEELGWNKPAAQYERYLVEQGRGESEVLVAFEHDVFAGYLTVVWQSAYQPFGRANIPEVVDFNVLPHLRRRGIGSRLMDAAERRIAERSPVAGIGVGMDADYGAAQRLYVLRGYVPDGLGLSSHGRRITHGQTIVVDDDLALYFTKNLCP